MSEAKQIESATLTRKEADVIRALMEEFYVKDQLEPEEIRVLLTLCSKFDFGRPVRGI